MVALTEKAAEFIKEIRSKNNADDKALRIAVVGGGCSGYQYQLGFDEKGDNDSSYDSHGVAIVVDSKSVEYLNGVEIDHVETMQGGSLVFNKPNQSSCNCGSGDSGCH